MFIKSFSSLSRVCFDVLSMKRQRHRKQIEPVEQPNLLYRGQAATTGGGGGLKLESRREGDGTHYGTSHKEKQGHKN